MDQTIPKVAPGSPLHRLLWLTPGYAPAWFLSRSACEGIDVLMLPVAVLVLSAGWVSKLPGWGWVWFPAIVLIVLHIRYVYMPFESRERWGRAR